MDTSLGTKTRAVVDLRVAHEGRSVLRAWAIILNIFVASGGSPIVTTATELAEFCRASGLPDYPSKRSLCKSVDRLSDLGMVKVRRVGHAMEITPCLT